jgi:glycosyltransferase involved in cell wall biosynthesis
MSTTSPLVSVVMAVHNGSPYLRLAIDSILAQTFEDFEFIIVNDGSTDDTERIIRSYSDPRIQLITQSKTGFVSSLNRSIERARGAYIARMDADDISDSTRLSKQVAILNERRNVGVVGSAIIRIDGAGRKLRTEYFLANDAELRQDLILRCPFAHGSVMMRRDLVQEVGGYRQEFWLAEDYDLWRRMADVCELANTLEPLYYYREHTQGVTAINEARMAAVAARISREVLDRECLSERMSLSRALAFYRHCPEEPRAAALSRICENYYRLILECARRRRILLAGVRLAKMILSGRAGFEFAAKKFARRIGVRAATIRHEPA